jgi:hypothetical protein
MASLSLLASKRERVTTRYDKREPIYRSTIDVGLISTYLRDPVP